jgi:hypothetical protein
VGNQVHLLDGSISGVLVHAFKQPCCHGCYLSEG